MIELVRKRHPAPGWIVLEEVGNATGGNVRRHADAVAVGIWPSHGHAIEGFEFKASRSDVQRELADPSKADAVGKYCDAWWLVVSDLKIIDGLVIPPTWGILYPKARVLRVHRKAPKRSPTPITRAFAAALIRRVTDSWVTKEEHNHVKRTAMDAAKAELARDREWKKSDLESELADLRNAVVAFEQHSGVEITQTYRHDPDAVARPLNSWQLARIGDAVKAVISAREAIGSHLFGSDDPAELVRRELSDVENAITRHERAIASRRAAAEQLRRLVGEMSDGEAMVPPVI